MPVGVTWISVAPGRPQPATYYVVFPRRRGGNRINSDGWFTGSIHHVRDSGDGSFRHIFVSTNGTTLHRHGVDVVAVYRGFEPNQHPFAGLDR